MIEKSKLYELRSKSKQIQPIIRIGKNALTDGLLKEISMHLKKKKLIKVKVLKNAFSKLTIDELIEKITSDCNCILVDKIGLTFSLYRINKSKD